MITEALYKLMLYSLCFTNGPKVQTEINEQGE